MELITKAFAQQCLAFPSRVDAMLAQIETVSEAKDMLDKASAMKHYAEKLKGGIEIEKPIAIGVLKIKAKIGELAPAKTPQQAGAMKGEKGPGSDPVPFDSSTIAAYRKIAANIDKLDEFCEELDDVPTQGAFLEYIRDPHVAHNSVENEWYTPAVYIEAARKVMGSIDLDPASSDVAQRTVKAKKFFTIDDDGLTKKWSGNVWLNPPYSKDLVSRFTSRLRLAFEDELAKQAVVLVNNATETIWFQELASVASVLCFCSGRIKFSDANGVPANSPLQGQCFLYLGHNIKAFTDEFCKFGFVCGRTTE